MGNLRKEAKQTENKINAEVRKLNETIESLKTQVLVFVSLISVRVSKWLNRRPKQIIVQRVKEKGELILACTSILFRSRQTMVFQELSLPEQGGDACT